MASPQQQVSAREHYARNVQRAQIADMLGLITGRNTDLVSFEEVARKLKARQQVEIGTQMVPLNKIVGSVGRYRDFTRTFLPRASANPERWIRLDAAVNALETVPPVELFKIGDVYFVRDGNHRVSVARANGVSHIEARVTEVKTPIPLTVDDFERDQWLIKAERADFMARTRLDELRPESDIQVTEPGRYEIMLHHIEVHRYLRDQELARSGQPPLTWEEAVCSWYDWVYMPVIEAIRRYDLLTDFPHRTEADLYLWIAYHRERLAREYDLAPLDPDTAVQTFASLHDDNLLARTWKGLMRSFHRLFVDEIPLGMSEEEFEELRARHDAGELSISEAEAVCHKPDPTDRALSSAAATPEGEEEALLVH
ncbi:MAG: hypothetical protein DCC55_18480 [Chloroflexi bacterium]|nr:MAG: hypothetical protein DCC55_18480 [Chloroflexota bacterium]